MKNFIAFVNNSNSGITTEQGAIDWAKKMMKDRLNVTEVHVTEIKSTVQRTEPPIRVVPYGGTGTVEGTEAELVGTTLVADVEGALLELSGRPVKAA